MRTHLTKLVCGAMMAGASAGACAHGGSTPKGPAPAPADTVSTASGLRYFITRRGKGPLPAPGQLALVHYTGSLASTSKVFDSSRERGTPIGFRVGMGDVIKGWDEGVALLHVGDRAMFVIPPALGYGAANVGNGLIPPNSTLVFDVELMALKDSAALPALLTALGKGRDTLRATFAQMKKRGDLQRLYFSEDEVNQAGYAALQMGRFSDAVALLELNADEFPKSYNTHDSLGEAYLAAGDMARAKAQYQLAAKLNPQKTDGDKQAYVNVMATLARLGTGK